MRVLVFVVGVLMFVGCADTKDHGKLPDCLTDGYSQYVDPKIGSGGHGHVFVGANVPFSFVQLGPTSIPQEWDWTSGYHDSDSTVIGFSHTHLSGTGIGDLCDVTIMPIVGDVVYGRGKESDITSGMWSYADRTQEIARPGYYSVPLMRYGIKAEMTTTERVGFSRYTFPQSDSAAIVIDLQNGNCWDTPTETSMQADGNTKIVGYRYSKGWADNQKIYFVAEFSKPFDNFELVDAESRFARVSFKTLEDEQVMVKVALSPVSIEGAKANMLTELPAWDFNKTIELADAKWEAQLAKINVETSSVRDKRIFYTALYHTMIAPSLFCDMDGSYFGADHNKHANPGFQTYTTFSLWDTYRAAHPLMSLIHGDRISDIINTMINIYAEQGKLPVWHLMGNETDCMVGNPGVAVVADAITKDIKGVDMEKAWEAVKNSAMRADRGQDLRMKYGFIPSDLFNESIAYDMEYAIADGAAAMAAEKLGKTEDYEYFKNRSYSYRNYFDKSTEFARGRFVNGSFRTPFDPTHSTHREDDYCEGNAWQYTWLAPHDVEGLVNCFPSKDAFVKKLDQLFLVSSEIAGESSPDISGLIGQYAHGNEPSHHILYLYTMIGEPWKTADRVREVLDVMYSDKPDGLSGNEDVGQMSAWYVLSALGFYQVEPAGGDFYFGSPIFDKAEISVAGGKFMVVANNNSKENKYIQSVKLNGKSYNKPYLSYKDIVAGGSLELEMGADANNSWY